MRKFICLILLILIPFTSSAWWARGHMVVAALAYLELDKNQQNQVTELLKNHPEYERLWKKEYEKYKKKMDLGIFLMMRASVWADEIKNRKHPFHEESHGNWHYVTYKITFPDQHSMALPDGEKEPNVVWAIQQTQAKVLDTSLEKSQRAISLAWLIHLVGDIHQPLHCGSEFSETYPKGDRGGNDQYVRPKRKAMRLHGLWDSSLGKKSHHGKAINQAIKLKKAQKEWKYDTGFNPIAWSKESFGLVITDVLQNGKLETSVESANAPKLNREYLAKMKTISEKRGGKAGIRLAVAVKDLKLN